MKEAASLYIPLVILTLVVQYISEVAQGTFPQVVLIAVILALIGAAVAVYKGLEPYSTVLCALALLVSLMSGLIPTGSKLQTALLLPSVVPCLMVILQSGEHGSLLWRLAYQRGAADNMNSVLTGDTGDKEQDDHIEFLFKIYAEGLPKNITEANAMAATYGYNDKALNVKVFQRHKFKLMAAQNNTKTAKSPVQRGPVSRNGGQRVKRQGGF